MDDFTRSRPAVAPYGTWLSPISAAALAEGASSVSDLRVDDSRLYWLESRPAEGGRQVLMTWDGAATRQLTPDGFNVRTRVHEYGGAPYLADGETIWFANFADQRLWRQAGESAPVPLTETGYRWADLVAAPGGGLIGVREDHTDPANVRNVVVALTGEPGDSGVVLFGDADFVAYPRVSRDGARLAWIAWDHPSMPWDDTRLFVADLRPGGLETIEAVAGGPGESVVEPQWAADGSLYFISDRGGFWNLHVRKDRETAPVLTMDAEFAGPLWQLGQANYVLMDDGDIVARHASELGSRMVVIPRGGPPKDIPLPFSHLGSLHRFGAGRVALIAASGEETAAVVTVDIKTGEAKLVRRPSPVALDPRYISRAQPISFPTADGGETAHGLYYPPANGDFIAPEGETPPLIVQVHGGPTAQASSAFSLANQFWTSRGFAIVDVNYRGSSGYGRAYRQGLKGAWGVVDVEDVIAAAGYLARAGQADPRRTAIHGGSAGGFTVLAALSQSQVFQAGASFYGVADLAALVRDTHKFESRYLDGLVGPWPQAKAVYEDRSPLSHLEGFTAPLIIFQGADDPIVPPNQAHVILEALRDRQRPVAYMEFAGESHGFRRARTIIASKEAELYFVGRIFGFTPADTLAEIAIENLPRA
jgi:dipeptidyl aminopeptidase/acylaminoacyl peptidase